MPSFSNTVRSNNFTTSITGGTLADGDTVTLQEGADVYNAGMSLGGITLVSLLASAGYRGYIPAGSVLIMDVASGGAGNEKIEFSGSSWYRQGGTDAAITTLTWSPSGGGYGQYSTFSSGITTAFVTRGSILFADDTDINTVLQIGGSCTCVESGSHTGTTIRITGGTHTTDRQFASVYVHGGTLLYGAGNPGVTGPGTRVEITGGTLVYMGGNIGGGLYGFAGTVDFSKLPAAITITGGEEWEGLTIINPPPGIVITWSPTVRGKGATRI